MGNSKYSYIHFSQIKFSHFCFLIFYVYVFKILILKNHHFTLSLDPLQCFLKQIEITYQLKIQMLLYYLIYITITCVSFISHFAKNFPLCQFIQIKTSLVKLQSMNLFFLSGLCLLLFLIHYFRLSL